MTRRNAIHLAAVLGAFLLTATATSQTSRYALRFYGTGTDQQDRVRIPIDDDSPGPDASAPIDVGAGDFTFEFWMRGLLADNRAGSRGGDREFFDYRWIDGNIILDRDIWGGSQADFGISIAGGLVQFGTDSGANNADSANTIGGDVNVLDGSWHHVAVVRDARTGIKRIYVDGELDMESSAGASTDDLSYPNSGAPTQNTPWGPYIFLGVEKHDAGPSYPSFNGYMDEFRVWSIARTAEEIRDDLDRIVPGDAPGLVGYYQFEEGSGTVVRDSSEVGSPDGLLVAGIPGNGEWVSADDDPDNTAPIGPGNSPPIVVATADRVDGPPPLVVRFSGSASSDPDGGPEPLTFRWDFGDGDSSDIADVQHTYIASGRHVARLRVSDGFSASTSEPIEINVGNRPAAMILTPEEDTTYRAGDTIDFSGVASDVEDGELGAASFAWRVWLRESASGDRQLFLGPILETAASEFDVPRTGFEPRGTVLEVELTVEDSDGLRRTETRALVPESAILVIDTIPAGIPLSLDGGPLATPRELASLIGFDHTLEAPSLFDIEGVRHVFECWSDGGERAHSLRVPEDGDRLTAVFQASADAVDLDTPVEAQNRNADYNPAFGLAYSNNYDSNGLCCGRDSGGPYLMGLAFELAVPPGAVVQSARVTVTPTSDQRGLPVARIRAYDAADVAPFPASDESSLTELHDFTSSEILWDFQTFTAGLTVESPDISVLIQEVIVRDDWRAGGYVGLVVDGTESAAGTWRCVRNFSSGSPPRLEVTYSVPGEPNPELCETVRAGGWKRCDFNCDGRQSTVDVLAALGYLFLDGPGPCCAAQLDCNGDAVADVGDWVFLLFHIFVGNVTAPPPPFSECGTGAGEVCATYDACKNP